MSVFILKIIAAVSMIIDHIGYAISTNWFVLPGHMCFKLRAVGRVAFPVYAFLLTNGFHKTSDRVRYLSRMLLFAAISQIPYSLMTGGNFRWEAALPAVSLEFTVSPLLAAVLIVCVSAVWFFFVRRDFTALYPGLVLAMASVRLEVYSLTLLGSELNVFYTLSFGLIALCLIDKLRDCRLKDVRSLCALLLTALVMLVYIGRCDYDWHGLALIVILYASQSNRYVQAALMAIWCYVMYKDASTLMLCCSFIAPLLILLYNGRRGRSFKLGFYLIYPVHILLISLYFILVV